MTKIRNPILPGFNPDPSICRTGGDFYIATSTFEWFPGVQIWHSRNLKDWRLHTRPLDEKRLLDLCGVQSSGGVWAPCLTFNIHDSLYYLVYTVVRSWRGETSVDFGIFKDTPNFLITASSIDGPWSDPVYLNSSGFDPSLFHDNDGRSWLLNMEWDYRGKNYFTGILLQEYDAVQRKLRGSIRKIFKGTEIAKVEGPHLYKRKGYYYLMTAEGGTGFFHAVTLARSKNIGGPYELHPYSPLINSLEDRSEYEKMWNDMYSSGQEFPDIPQGFYDRPQRVGHGSMCELFENEWVLVHLGSRPLPTTMVCPMGRETSIQRLIWKDDNWPYVLNQDGEISQLAENDVQFDWSATEVNQRTSVESRTEFSFRDDFTGPALNPNFRFLRQHPGRNMELASGGCSGLRLFGAESPVSLYQQTVVAVSLPFYDYVAETELRFLPDSFQQMAGLMVRYDERNQYYLHVSYDNHRNVPIIQILQFVWGRPVFSLGDGIELDPHRLGEGLRLRLVTIQMSGKFSYAYSDEDSFSALNVDLDMAQLSDERTWPEGFTGTFVGLAAHDLTGQRTPADFRYFSLQER